MNKANTCHLLLMRHGETEDNVRQIMQGQTEGLLTERGREQALQVANRLASEPVDVVVCSDLRRARQTAEIIAMPRQLPVFTTPLLRERDWGSFTQCFIPALKGVTWPDDIETEEALFVRARSFIIYITATFPGKRIVAVGHGIINKAILAVVANCEMSQVQRMMNAEVRRLTLTAETLAAAASSAAAVRTPGTAASATDAARAATAAAARASNAAVSATDAAARAADAAARAAMGAAADAAARTAESAAVMPSAE